MELGGNEKAFKTFQKIGVLKADGKADYQSSKLQKYIKDLAKEVSLSLSAEGYSEASTTTATVVAPTPPAEQKPPQTSLVFQSSPATTISKPAPLK